MAAQNKLQYPIEILSPTMNGQIPGPKQDEQVIKKQYYFTEGRWIPAAEPLTLTEKDFTDVGNVRQGKNCIEGVQGYTKQYTSAGHSIYYKCRGGIQLRTNTVSTKSRIIGQFWNSSLISAALFQNITSIPGSGSFVGSVLFSDTTGMNFGRFAVWPDNQIVYCNGVDQKIYGGDEMRCAAFITTAQEVTGATTVTPQNYSDQITNDLQSEEEVARIGGENDSNALLLLNFNGGASATIQDTSGKGHGMASTVGGAKTTVSYYKFGDACLGFDSSSGAIEYSYHANWNSIKTIDKWVKDLTAYASAYSCSEAVINYISHLISNCSMNVVTGDAVCIVPVSATTSGIFTITSVIGDTLFLDAGDTLTSEIGADFQIYHIKSLMGRYANASNFWQLLNAGPNFHTILNYQSGGIGSYGFIGNSRTINASTFYHLGITASAASALGTSIAVFVSGASVYAMMTDFGFHSVVSGNIRFGNTNRCASNSRSVSGKDIYFDEIRLSDRVRYTIDFTAMSRAYVLTGRTFLIGSLRPLRGGHFYIAAGNTQISALTMKTWAGTSWSSVTITDNTSSGGIALAQSGTWGCESTVGTSKLKYLDGYVLYWYQFTLSAGEATIYKVTLDADIQDVNDVFNGEQTLVGALLKYEGTYEDYTDYMNDDSRETYVSLYNLTTAQYLLGGFPIPMCGFVIDTVEGNVNSTIASMIINYCNGNSLPVWPTVPGFHDGTANGSITLNHGGVVFWNPLNKGEEFKTAIGNDNKLYYYKIGFTAQLATGSAHIWKLRGIPAPQKILPYRFPFMFKNRPMLCGLEIANQGHRVDYGQVDAYAFFNGSDSSLGIDGQSLYFGNGDSLTAACSLFNRIGSSLYHTAVFTKDNETWILNGYDAESYEQFQISDKIGCPAWMTMDTIEIGYGDRNSNQSEPMKCIALWLSGSGPVTFDITNITPIWDDIACYFDDTDPRCVNYSEIKKSVGWTDTNYMEYNLCIPSGSGQTTNNVWLFYDLVNRKWWKRENCSVPQAIAKVMDTDGTPYVYGFFDDGIMRRLEYGKYYDSTEFERYVETTDIIPDGDMWNVTRLERLKLLTGKASETAYLSITYAASGTSISSGVDIGSVYTSTSQRFIKDTQRLNLLGWSHKLRFAITGGVTDKGLKLIAWGAQFTVEREDKEVS
jgi:hypothetical protein